MFFENSSVLPITEGDKINYVLKRILLVVYVGGGACWYGILVYF